MQDYEFLRQVLLGYSEWLDAEQHLMVSETPDDRRTHSDLVAEYLGDE